MTREISHTVEIDAPPPAVWAVLADTSSFLQWNPFIRSLSGDLRAGARLRVRIEPPGGRSMAFRPTVLALRPERELRWRGRLIVPGLFDGEHSFSLEPSAAGGTRIVQAERFSGMLVRALGGAIAKTEVGFGQMNAALKARCEAAHRSPQP